MRTGFPGPARPPGPLHSPADAQPDRRKPGCRLMIWPGYPPGVRFPPVPGAEVGDAVFSRPAVRGASRSALLPPAEENRRSDSAGTAPGPRKTAHRQTLTDRHSSTGRHSQSDEHSPTGSWELSDLGKSSPKCATPMCHRVACRVCERGRPCYNEGVGHGDVPLRCVEGRRPWRTLVDE